MKRSCTRLLSLVALLSACGNPKVKPGFGEPSPASAQPESKWTPPAEAGQSSEFFNLARYVKENPNLSSLHEYVGDGNAYLFFGDRTKFKAETNFQINADASSLDPNVERGIDAQYWLDFYALDQKLGVGGRGFIVDIGASATLDHGTLEAHVRLLGDDKFRASAQTAIEQKFTRDFGYDFPYYPIPAVALTVGGAIGGEIGIRGELGLRRDNALQLTFVPLANVHAKVQGGIKLVEVIYARAEGIMKLLESNVKGSASLGLIPSASYSYGNVGMDGGGLNALDGKIDLVAGAGYDGILPGGVDKIVFEQLINGLGYGVMKNMEWRYTIYDPKPITGTSIDSYGRAFMAFFQQPSDHADCESKRDAISAEMSQHMTDLNSYKDKMKVPEDKKLVEVAIAYLGDIKTQIAAYCE